MEIPIPSNILLKRFYRNFNLRNTFNYPFWINSTIEQLFSYIRSTEPSQRKFFELEIKFGTFAFKGSCKLYEYINDVFSIPRIETDRNNSYQFNSNITETQFYALWTLVEDESKYNTDVIKCEPLNSKEVIYASGKRMATIFTKVGEDVKFKDKEVIIKQDKSHFNIRNNNNDMRITICKEFPTDITHDDTPVKERNKFRVSYKFRFFRLDFTIVNSKSIPDDFSTLNNETFEIEFELFDWNQVEIVTQNYQNYTDFENLIRRYIENVLCFYYAMNNSSFAKKSKDYNKLIQC